jgi:uncharacterized membrane protein YhaH (DUF805 family)
MNNEEIQKYIADERARGVRDEDIKKELLAKGWKENDVNIGLGISVTAASVHSQEFSFAHMFEGRLKRWQYFVISFELGFMVLTLLAVFFALTAVFPNTMGGSPEMPMWSWLFYAIWVPFHLSFAVRRIHDINWSGWLALLLFIPVVGIIFALIILLKKGTDGTNTYGPPQSDRKLWQTVFNR